MSVKTTETAWTTRPRLLPGAHGWWFVAERRSYLLSSGSVGIDGKLDEGVERQLRDSGAFQDRPPLAYTLTVLTSTACNLGCGYCFQNVAQDTSGGNRPRRIPITRLGRQNAHAIIDFAARQMAAEGLAKLTLHLFGGEPLLNPRGCRDLLERARDHGLSYAHMTSNGTLITPGLAEELNRLGLRAVQVTFDGNRHDHDRIRVTRAGGATFDTILDNLARASEVTDLTWRLQLNVSHHNHRGAGELLDQVASRLDPARCSFAFTLVDDLGVGYENTLPYDERMAAAFAGWTIKALELGFQISRPKAATPCAACSFPRGRYGAVVNADATLYSCWESAGKRAWAVGDVRNGYLPDEVIEPRWVACRYDGQRDPAALAAFRDRVDAQVLDHLYATGKL